MEMPEAEQPSQHLGNVEKSAVSMSGNAFTTNITGNQYITQQAPSEPWKPPVMLPLRAQEFVGRDEDLAWLLEQLQDDEAKILALCGPGGIGKTALAAQALAKFVEQANWLTRFPGGIFYYSFYPNPSLDVAFEELALTCQEDPASDPRRAALRALSRRRAILVFDGVEALADAAPLWELHGRHIVLLLSRRRSDAPNPAYRRELDLLAPEQGIMLLQRLADQQTKDYGCTQRLVQHTGGYPLALQIIGGYLSSHKENVADYLKWFEEEGLQALHHGERRTKSVRVLLQRSYASLTVNEQDIVKLLGLLAPAPFPLELVQDVLQLPERTVRHGLGALVNLSLLRRPEQEYVVSHPLVHTFAQECLSSQDAPADSAEIVARWRDRLLMALTALFEQIDPYDRSVLALWLPHVRLWLVVDGLTEDQQGRATGLFTLAGLRTLYQGRYKEAEPLLQRALKIRQEQLGGEHPDTAASLNNLAGLYESQGRYQEAEPLLQRAVTIVVRQLGEEHPHTQQVIANYLVLLSEMYTGGDLDALFQLLEQEMPDSDAGEGLT